MKKIVVVLAALVVAVALFGASAVSAQTQTPPGTGTGWSGMMGGGLGNAMRGMMGGAQDGTGIMHDSMVTAFAEKLGLSVDTINQRLAAGETMWQIAESEGLTAEEIQALMTAAHTEALAEAVANGTITQAQADWMNQRMAQGIGAGNCSGAGNGGMMGAGRGRMGGGGMMGGRGFRGGQTGATN